MYKNMYKHCATTIKISGGIDPDMQSSNTKGKFIQQAKYRRNIKVSNKIFRSDTSKYSCKYKAFE